VVWGRTASFDVRFRPTLMLKAGPTMGLQRSRHGRPRDHVAVGASWKKAMTHAAFLRASVPLHWPCAGLTLTKNVAGPLMAAGSAPFWKRKRAPGPGCQKLDLNSAGRRLPRASPLWSRTQTSEPEPTASGSQDGRRRRRDRRGEPRHPSRTWEVWRLTASARGSADPNDAAIRPLRCAP
jgi:hypothetical protein